MLLAVVVQVPISLGLAAYAPRGIEQPREEVMLTRLVADLPLLSPAAKLGLIDYVQGRSLFESRVARDIAYALPAAATTFAAVAVLLALLRAPGAVDATTVRLLFRFACATAALRLIALPILTGDFWLSVAWGRMIVDGLNPYVVEFTPSSVAHLPITGYPGTMTYGPAWAALSAGIAAVASHRLLLEYALFKLIIFAAWLITLALIRRLVADQPPFRQGMALALFGWIPASTYLSIAEGHNDIVMVMFMTLWLYLFSVRSPWSPLALTLSALVKYITAPLLAFEALHAGRMLRTRPVAWLIAIGLSLAYAAALFVPFVGGGNPFAATTAMRSWEFWTPGAAIATATSRFATRIPVGVATAFVTAACGLLFLRYLLRYSRSRSLADLVALQLAVMVLIMFAVVGHVWPWFLLWSLPLIALRWDCLPGQVLLAAFLLLPILNAHWIFAETFTSRHDLGVVYYLLVAAFALLIRATIRGARMTTPAAVWADAVRDPVPSGSPAG